MRIVKYIRSLGKDRDFFIDAAAPRFTLEWSGPTREKSGRSCHESLAAAMAEATRLFQIFPERWTDGEPLQCPPWRQDARRPPREQGALLPDVWEFFSWSAPQLPDLIHALRIELVQRITKHEEEKERYPNDADERSINRAWCDELAATVRRWCRLLAIDPDDLPGYRKALRQNVWNEDLIRTDAIARKVLATLRARGGTGDPIFRPLCLREAHKALLEWLREHPSDVDRVHHRTFEAIVAETIRAAGWSVELTKQTRDGGYDIMCLKHDGLGFPIKILVETKLYSLNRSVGLPMVDRLMGVRDRERADQAVLVTNSRITAVAWALWQDRVGRDLKLVDREELLEWLSNGRARVLSADSVIWHY